MPRRALFPHRMIAAGGPVVNGRITLQVLDIFRYWQVANPVANFIMQATRYGFQVQIDGSLIRVSGYALQEPALTEGLLGNWSVLFWQLQNL
jgi:hypothetical protein